ncbi:MAG: MBL fold metallo-hydrolase [Solobacterium sp.]|nr:MBL fold metallo-hydrolase [Solobacterium sp.]
MNIITIVTGAEEENVYVVKEKHDVVIIDPGDEPSRILKALGHGDIVHAILLTHGHSDHVGAVDDLAEGLGCPVFIHPADMPLVSPPGFAEGFPVYTPLQPLAPEHVFGKIRVRVLPTPGHTAGSVCFRIRSSLFSGDTLFAADIGRTDLWSSDEAAMLSSLALLHTLPPDTKVYPGHGPDTTIGLERKVNPWFLDSRFR